MSHARDYSISDVPKDGTRVTIRAIRPADRKGFREVVEEDYQGRGIASRLLAHLAWLASLHTTGARVVVVGDGVNDVPMP